MVEKTSDLPFESPEDAKGIYHNGTIYLVVEQIALAEDANEVIIHEFVGHFGLNGFFGDKIRPALHLIHINNPLVRKYSSYFFFNWFQQYSVVSAIPQERKR